MLPISENRLRQNGFLRSFEEKRFCIKTAVHVIGYYFFQVGMALEADSCCESNRVAEKKINYLKQNKKWHC